MPSFLFWNVARNPAAFPHVVRLATSKNCDVIILAECPNNIADLIPRLNSNARKSFRDVAFGQSKVKVITSLSKKRFYPRLVSPNGDLSIWKLDLSGNSLGVIQFAFVHLLSKVSASDNSLTANAIEVATRLTGFEDSKEGCHNTVLIGDMNMNPFDGGLVVFSGFHAAMTLELAQKERIWKGKSYRKFYNPMWGFFGDRTPGPPGSYYWPSSADDNHQWQILDHVLLRPAMVKYMTELAILDHDGMESLTNHDGIPTKDHISDHLPIFCRFEF